VKCAHAAELGREAATGWAYSVDLRERVVAAFDRSGMTDQEAAARFKIGEAV
jgi:transposase